VFGETAEYKWKADDLNEAMRHSKEREVTRYFRPGKDGKDGEHVPGGFKTKVPNFYTPGFRSSRNNIDDKSSGDILGTVGDWLKEMGAEVSDLAPALAKVKASKEYKDLLALGFDDVSTEKENKNGTLHFIGHYQHLIGDDDRTEEMVRRKVFANGNIRTHADRNTHHAGRGNAAHPKTAKTDPHMKPVDRIAQSMRASIERIGKIYQVEAQKRFLASAKASK
jgi:hypothetical protein